jgi:hypothetical protein
MPQMPQRFHYRTTHAQLGQQTYKIDDVHSNKDQYYSLGNCYLAV